MSYSNRNLLDLITPPDSMVVSTEVVKPLSPVAAAALSVVAPVVASVPQVHQFIPPRVTVKK